MRSLLEKAIVHLLNEENAKAEELFHKFLVARARQIHEDVRQGEDEALTKDWDEDFSADDLSSAEGDEVVATDDIDSAEGDLGDAGEELDAAADDLEGELGDDVDGELGDVEGDVEDRIDNIEDRFDTIQDHLDALTAQFDEIMGDDAGDDLDDASLDGDIDGVADEGDDFGGEKSVGDEGEVEGDEFGAEGEEDDVEDEDYNDITESIVDELEKISVDGRTDGKEVGAGKTVQQNRASSLPGKKANPGDAKPVLTKSQNNDSFERETAPTVKPVAGKARNTRKTSKEGTSTVQKQGDGKALLNKDFAGKQGK